MITTSPESAPLRKPLQYMRNENCWRVRCPGGWLRINRDADNLHRPLYMPVFQDRYIQEPVGDRHTHFSVYIIKYPVHRIVFRPEKEIVIPAG